MRRFFVANIIFLLLLNLIVKPLWIFGIDRNVQNFVGHASYGQYQALLSFSLIFQIFLDFGLQSFNSRSVAQSPKTMSTLFPNILWTKVFLSLIYFVLIVIIGLLIGFRGYDLFLLLLLGFVQTLNSLLLFLRSNVSGMHQFKKDSILSVTDKLLMLLICGVLLYYPPLRNRFTIEWFIYAQIAAYLISALIAFKLCLGLGEISWAKFRPLKIIAVAKMSLPYAFLIFFMAIYLRADSVILERILPNGKEQAGIFAASFRLLDVANNMTGVLFAGILLPLFGRMIVKKEDYRPIVRISLNLMLPVALTTVVFAFFWGDEIMSALYTEASPVDGLVFLLLMCAFPGYCIGYVYATLLTANGSLKQLIYISVVALVLNLTLNFVLIPHYGVLAAALVAALTQILLSIMNLSLARKYMNLKTDGKWLFQYALFIGLIFGIGWVIQQTDWTLLIKLGSVAVGALIFMSVLGFIPVKKMMEYGSQILNRGV